MIEAIICAAILATLMIESIVCAAVIFTLLVGILLTITHAAVSVAERISWHDDESGIE